MSNFVLRSSFNAQFVDKYDQECRYCFGRNEGRVVYAGCGCRVVCLKCFYDPEGVRDQLSSRPCLRCQLQCEGCCVLHCDGTVHQLYLL